MLLNLLLLASLLATPGLQRIEDIPVPQTPETLFPNVSSWARESVFTLHASGIQIKDISREQGSCFEPEHSHWSGRSGLRRQSLLELIRRLRAVRSFDTVYPDPVYDGLFTVFSPPEMERQAVAKLKDWKSIYLGIYHDEAEEIGRIRLFNAYPDGTFRGDGNTTRAELAVIIARLLQRLPYKPPLDLNKTILKQQDGNEWWYGAALIAIGSGMMEGYPDGWFRGNRRVTCREAAVVFARLLALAKSDVK